MITEELEFQISQYADGTLPAAEAAALEALLSSDAEARAMLESYRKLTVAMKRELALPAVNWDRLSGHLSGVIDAAEERERSKYRIQVSTFSRIAMAAMVLLAIGAAGWLITRPTDHGQVATKIPNPTPIVAVAEITGPAVEQASQPPVEEVAIGPSPEAQHLNYAAAEDIIYRTPHVVIASSQFQRQDIAALPF